MMVNRKHSADGPQHDDHECDAVLIGGGIMSATLGALLTRLEPDRSILVLERLDEVAAESSAPWNNAGTGHAGLCELNYMPDPEDSTRAEEIGRQFRISRQFWESLDEPDETTFVNATPHMNVVFGERDVDYLRRRHATLQRSLLFSAMEYSEDPDTIVRWAPLVMGGRSGSEPIAATHYEAGTDVDFGALTHRLLSDARRRGVELRTGHEVTRLRRTTDGRWTVSGRTTTGRFSVRSRFVFVGAGGYALKLLQKARIPEVRGFAVFPIGAQFLRTGNPDVVSQHAAKVYSQADVGAPPMSVPHLDKRIVDGRESLMFGPYATFSTRLLKHGRLTDLFTTLRPHNIAPLVAVGLQNLSLVRYLVGQLLASRARKFRQLQRFCPEAQQSDWELIDAGQRAQLVKPDRRRVGVLTFGTEVVASADGSIAGLLGASPGASIAPSAMVELLSTCFPDDVARWRPVLERMMPDLYRETETTSRAEPGLARATAAARNGSAREDPSAS
ncbi:MULTISPECIES: malate dehydrogenase (quinone) [unclassified Rhodococcus (in: high G+C Gram-positive bacteria)]|uniref:malate dehydrogenase (quinone) n=1 Tax=unclassified Rhodococcus (in: high G+C Gram-positive bacteria) TaxID=192944 RepID=UPI00233EF5EA|nr:MULTISPECIES: malate dehydrogenase (quinone) [unclassified Rhodococcus (in: high G+C Gram-positive bacteria)]MDC3726533.1 malate dehydrogenase (quinone) [Rhodococcus sp. Rp3]WSE24906.1 malate dehydrogenase (quinone) [Rhodococcus sp. PD04]